MWSENSQFADYTGKCYEKEKLMNSYVEKIEKLFRSNANTENAEPMAKYMKNKFPYLGIKTPKRKELLREFHKKNSYPEVVEIEEIASQFWALPEREFQYVAIGLLCHFSKKVGAEFIELYEFLITEKSWWDSVDGIATWLVGDLFKNYPEMIPKYSEKWMKSENIWLMRTVILFQLHYKSETDFPLLIETILRCRTHTEFFIQKAIGWALREYSKTDAQSVINFVQNNQLVPLSEREALKWLKNKGKDVSVVNINHN